MSIKEANNYILLLDATFQTAGDSILGYSWYQNDEDGEYHMICRRYPEPVAHRCSQSSAYQLRVTYRTFFTM